MLEGIFSQQKKAFLASTYPSYRVRYERLVTLRRVVVANAEFFAKAISADFGIRTREETFLTEVMVSLSEIDLMIKNLRRWMKPRSVSRSLTTFPASGKLIAQPRGVIGILVPWNYPLALAVGPLADAFAAGNNVMVKLSEFAPNFAALFHEVMSKAFDESIVAIVEGDASVAKAFSKLPFDEILYTGNSFIARDVMREAAQNLTPVLLELGGKSNVVIAPDARFNEAIRRLMVGKLLNAGQTCIAPDTVWVEKEKLECFVAEAKEWTHRLYPDPMTLTSIIGEKHQRRLQAMKKEALEKGERVVELFNGKPAHPKQEFPILVIDPKESLAISREEIFGPYLLVRTYTSIESVIENLKGLQKKPLALYWFDCRAERITRVQREIAAGGITVNDTLLHFVENHLPFGGVGESGMGVYHGYEGFKAMSHMLPVLTQSRVNFFGMMDPPYSSFARKIVQWFSH